MRFLLWDFNWDWSGRLRNSFVFILDFDFRTKMESNTFGTFSVKQTSTRTQSPGDMDEWFNKYAESSEDMWLYSKKSRWAWWYTLIVPATWGLRQEDCLSSGILGSSVLCGSGIHTKVGINVLTTQGQWVAYLLKLRCTGPGQKIKSLKLRNII